MGVAIQLWPFEIQMHNLLSAAPAEISVNNLLADSLVNEAETRLMCNLLCLGGRDYFW